MAEEKKSEAVETSTDDVTPHCYLPRRYVIIVLCAIGMCLVHAMRVNIAVTVVTILDSEAYTKVGTMKAIVNLPDVRWDARMVGFLHSSFYVGYLITLIPGGFLATLLPSHRLFGSALLASSSLNLLLPLCIMRFGYVTTCVMRGMQGLCEGVFFPASYAIMGHWTTPEERSRMGSIVVTGIYLGPVIGLPLAGFITHYMEWEAVYYISGGAGIVWFIVWLFIAHESPASDPSITDHELKLLNSSNGDTSVIYQNERVPWWDIMTSLPVHALNICNFARSFVFFLLLTSEPTYLNTFHFSLAENGMYSALPHILMTTTSALSGPMADWLMRNPMLSSTDVRKMFTCIGFFCEAIFLFCLYIIDDGVTALIFLTLGVGCSGFTVSGWQINHLDLAPRYASVLVGFSTAVGTIAGIVNPIVVGHITQNQQPDEWHLVFLITSLVLLAAVIFYLFFGSGNKQPWAEPSNGLLNNTDDVPAYTKPSKDTADTQPVAGAKAARVDTPAKDNNDTNKDQKKSS